MRWTWLCCLPCLLCCAKASPEESRSRHEAIIDGTASTLESVVMVRDPAGLEPLCSGVQITPGTILTAQHCVVNAEGVLADVRLIGFGDLEDTIEEYPSTEIIPLTDEPSSAAIAAGSDLAIIRHEAEQTTRTCVAGSSLSRANRDQVTLHGFGISDTSTGMSGTKLQGAAEIEDIDSETGRLTLVGDGACLGDSGGPVISDEAGAVIGIMSAVSSTDEESCSEGWTVASGIYGEKTMRFLSTHAPEGLCDPGAIKPPAEGLVDTGGGAGGEMSQKVRNDQILSGKQGYEEAGCSLTLGARSMTLPFAHVALVVGLIGLRRKRDNQARANDNA